LLEAIGLDFGEVLRHDQDDGLYDLESSFTEDGAILATVKTVPGGISDVATIKEEIKHEVAEHLKEHGFTELQPGQQKQSPGGDLRQAYYAHTWQIRETADGKVELYTGGRKMITNSVDDKSFWFGVSSKIFNYNFQLLGRITVEEARHGPWHLRILRPLSAGTDGDMHHLHLNSLEVYDQTGAKLSLTYNGNASEYVKRGHGDPALTPANVIDGNLKSLSHNDYSGNAKYGSQDHWMEFDIAEASVYGSGTPTTAVISNKHWPSRLAGARLFFASFHSEGMASSPTVLTLTGETNQTVELA